MCIPKDAVEANYGKLKEIMNVKEKKKKLADKKDKALSAIPEYADEEESDDSDDDDMIDNLETRDDLHSRAQLFLSLTGQYCAILFFISLILAIVMAVTYLLSVMMQQANIRTQLASDLRFLSWRIGYLTKMMAWNDERTYENVKLLRTVVKEDHDEMLEVKDAFMFGSEKYKLSYSQVETNIRPELFDHNFLNDT